MNVAYELPVEEGINPSLPSNNRLVLLPGGASSAGAWQREVRELFARGADEAARALVEALPSGCDGPDRERWRARLREASILRLAARQEGVSYDDLMAMAAGEPLLQDELFETAEALVAAPQPRLERRFVERATSRVLKKGETAQVLRLAGEGKGDALAALDVVYTLILGDG